MSRSGPASCALACNQHPGGARAKPPLRHYERGARMRYMRLESTAPLCNAQRLHRDGRGAKKSPRWSAERRASPGCVDCASWSARGRKASADACGPTSLARRRVPLHPSACRRSAPSRLSEGKTWQTSDVL